MHILRHKNWHVWNQDNVIKVRKDEQADKEAKERKRKRELEIVCFVSFRFPLLLL